MDMLKFLVHLFVAGSDYARGEFEQIKTSDVCFLDPRNAAAIKTIKNVDVSKMCLDSERRRRAEAIFRMARDSGDAGVRAAAMEKLSGISDSATFGSARDYIFELVSALGSM